MNHLGVVPCVIASVVAISACGGQSTSTHDGGGAAVHTGGTGTGGRGGNTTSCVALMDDAELSLDLQITNRTPRTLHLGHETRTCTSVPPISVEDGEGSELVLLDVNRVSCESVMGGHPTDGPGDCSSRAVTLKPGQRTKWAWNGLFQLQTTTPAECVPGGTTSDFQCAVARALQPGTHHFSVSAGSVIECDNGVCGECRMLDVGGCGTEGALIAGELTVADLTLKLDGGYGVGGLSGSGPPLPIEIAFMD